MRLPQLFQVLRRRLGVQLLRLQHDLLVGAQVQRAVEVRLGPPRIGRHHRRLPLRRSHPQQRRLQVQARCVFRQDHRLRRVLPRVDQFCSSCSSKAKMSRSERDVQTFCVRW